MKLFLLLICLNLTTLSFSQTCDPSCVLVDRVLYKVCYSEKYESPMWVKYKLYKPVGNCSRDGMDFCKEKGIHTADNNDFKGNRFDKGHMAPAEDFRDTPEHLKATFSYLNCTLQDQSLNRGLWKSLEEQVHKWSQTDSLIIVNEILFSDSSQVLPSGATVPDLFRKSITFLTTNKTIVYQFSNKDCNGKLEDYILMKN